MKIVFGRGGGIEIFIYAIGFFFFLVFVFCEKF